MFVIDNISKSYGRKQILQDISFTAENGSCTGLLGLNGSGKSTILNILAGCIKADSGSFYLKEASGKTVTGRELSSIISFLPQDNPLIPELSGMDNIKLWFNGRGKDIYNDYNRELFSKLGVDTFINKKVNKMSGGMKKRLSLAIAMMSKPKLILLDEPLAALDLLVKNGILTYLKEYIAQGGTIILATHETAALDICTDIYMLRDKKLQPVKERDDYVHTLINN